MALLSSIGNSSSSSVSSAPIDPQVLFWMFIIVLIIGIFVAVVWLVVEAINASNAKRKYYEKLIEEKCKGKDGD